MFAIEVDRANNRILHAISGFLDQDAVQKMSDRMADAVADIRRSSTWFDLVVDLTDALPAQRESGLAIENMAANLEALGVRRVAIISKGGLTSLQAKRLMGGGDRSRTFDTRADAYAWLETSG